MTISIADLRQDYSKAGLSEADSAENPIEQFKIWFEQAMSAQLTEPNAMVLATATANGMPSARMVLLKAFDERGFTFFTNYESDKGKQLAANPQAALTFWWAELERSVRIEGRIEKISETESDEYFQNRPRASQLGAWTSEQSEVIPDRELLEERLEHFREQYGEGKIPRPPHWGGYRVIPSAIEFWQGRPNRLHDRLRYRCQEDGSWLRERLSP
ncbi:pyridoxamine 5'-phosphate oxidase [Oscillatoria sp. FACHB-1406]|uniref:pyridoxamine 5'-phosphate oxidase n=1 Tax=Oscillatoria sp. FACHB-1406 TaxID=2692846 RepID=UPI0016859F9B|nr:pyridoxamine 5'-phosphate oxidase [Oscillatoria sp. FACHB-1406]MBD2577148.1 pyridoxamine 5'-phosphate oxidase [Oscillatoria sp. FACHB-1406]